MGLKGASRTSWTALIITLILLAASPGVANLQPTEGPAEAEEEGPVVGAETDLDPLRQQDPAERAGQPPNLQMDLFGWLEWSESIPLELFIDQARERAPEAGKQIVPAPDEFPGHDDLSQELKRDKWQSWAIAAEIAALRSPSVPVGPASASGEGASYQEAASGAPEQRNPFGDPHSLDQLWRLQVHGRPQILLPAGPGDESYLITDRGVLFLPSPGASPDWMLNVEGVAGHAEVVERDGRYDLVVGIHSLYRDPGTPSIWVIDGQQEEVRFSGLSGDKAMLYWTLTDVDRDGQDDILGVDVNGNVTAVALDGSEIYRKEMPRPEEVPTSEDLPDLPELPGGLDQFLVIAMQRTGMEAFGDATDDGIKDIFTTSTWGALGFQNSVVVTMADGKDGTVVWSHMMEPAAESFVRFATPTLTGDLDGDGLADVNIFDFYWGIFFGGGNTYFSGDEGLILAKDDSQLFQFGPTGILFSPTTYLPLAFLDLNGDGTKQIVSIETEAYYGGDRWYIEYRPVLEIRSLLPVPGGPTTSEETYWNPDLPWWIPAQYVQHSVVQNGDQESLVLLFPHYMTPADHYGFFITVDASGIDAKEPPQPIGHFAVNQQTGQRYAWLLHNDRYTPVNKDLDPQMNGTRLILSAYPLLTHDEDKDGTPDLLIRRSMGYFWISGKTGRIIDSIDRPMGASHRLSSLHDDGFVLESDIDHYILFDVKSRETVASVSRDIGDGANPRALGDFTGDGRLEILLHKYGWSFTFCDENGCYQETNDDEWIVYSPLDPGTVWKTTTDSGNGYPGKLVPERAGMQLLLIGWNEEADRANVTGYTPQKNGSGILWNRDFDYIGYGSHAQITDGHISFVEQSADGERIVVLDGKTGETRRSLPIEGGQLVWTRLLEGKGAPFLVTSTMEGSEDRRRQYVTAVDLEKDEILTTFRLQDPIVIETTHQYIGGSITVYNPIVNRPGPSVGDWDDDGVPDLAITERNWPVVRSLQDGEPIAVGPTLGRFTFTKDLNGDGQQEIAMDSGGSLRMFSFDPSVGELDEEDPFSRVDTVDPDDNENETVHKFFEKKEEKSPGPAILIVPLVLGLFVTALRRRNRA